MNKIPKQARIVTLLAVLLTIFLLAARPTLAQVKEFQWDSWDSDITLLENGELQVEETHTLDFRGEPFEGSKYLLAWADELSEIKTICHTGRKANMVVRVDEEGYALKEGAQVEIGGNDRYVSVSRAEFKNVFIGGQRIKFIEPVVSESEGETGSCEEQKDKGLL